MISLIIVNYRSAALAIEAIRTARAATSSPLQVIVVDNSPGPEEMRSLYDHADNVTWLDKNLGYAGGINEGRRAVRGESEMIVVSNPDVTFAPGALDTLAAALEGNVAVAGPALYWDEAFTWMLPPSDLHTGREKLGEVLASRSASYAKARDRDRIRKRIAFWSSQETREVKALSGAVMAIRKTAFDAVGGFDDRFALYFEENDFLRRIAERRYRIAYVPSARCRHLYNQSAAQSEEAASKYAASEVRYLEKWNGPFVARLMKKLERERKHEGDSKRIEGPVTIDRERLLVEASPLPTFETAAGSFTNVVDVPPDVWRSYRGSVLYFRAIDRGTAEVLSNYARYES